ncbi:MAG: DUF502 domain-containing protein [Sandaracinaceae bacterium]
MKTLAKNFFQGLIVLVPIVGSIYVVWWILTTLDSLYPLPVPGLGIAVTVVFITLLGALTRNVVGRRIVALIEAAMKRLPLVSIIYTSIRDLLGAFVGDQRSFDKPVMVSVADGVRVFGFITCDRFDDVRLAGHVAVYLPQSYNFAGNLMIVPRDRVESVDADSAQFMAFIVSGGVAEMSAARTVYDPSQASPLQPR